MSLDWGGLEMLFWSRFFSTQEFYVGVLRPRKEDRGGVGLYLHSLDGFPTQLDSWTCLGIDGPNKKF